AKEKDRLAQVNEDLTGFVDALDEVPELDALLRNPQIDPRAKADTLEAILGGVDGLVRHFLLVTIEKNPAGRLRRLRQGFERLAAAEERRLTVELTTAKELTDDEAREIVQQIEKASGRPVDASRRVDPDLIGGIVLQAGSMRVDASVRGRLERLRRQMTTTPSKGLP